MNTPAKITTGRPIIINKETMNLRVDINISIPPFFYIMN